MDDLDQELLALLQSDASQPYAALGRAVGLSAGAAQSGCASSGSTGSSAHHDRGRPGGGGPRRPGVRHGAGQRVDGDQSTRDALAALPEVQEAHVIAGAAALLLKSGRPVPRAAGHAEPGLQDRRSGQHGGHRGPGNLLRTPGRPDGAGGAGRCRGGGRARRSGDGRRAGNSTGRGRGLATGDGWPAAR